MDPEGKLVFLHCFVLIEMFYNIVGMKRSLSLMLIVTALLFTAVINGYDGTQTDGWDTEFVIDTDNGVSSFIFTSENSTEFAVGCGVEYVALFPGNDAIHVSANLSFGVEKYFIRSQKPHDLCPAPVFRNTKHFFG